MTVISSGRGAGSLSNDLDQGTMKPRSALNRVIVLGCWIGVVFQLGPIYRQMLLWWRTDTGLRRSAFGRRRLSMKDPNVFALQKAAETVQ